MLWMLLVTAVAVLTTSRFPVAAAGPTPLTVRCSTVAVLTGFAVSVFQRRQLVCQIIHHKYTLLLFTVSRLERALQRRASFGRRSIVSSSASLSRAAVAATISSITTFGRFGLLVVIHRCSGEESRLDKLRVLSAG